MSRKQLQHGPTIIPSQYGIGEIAPLPDRPEPTRTEPVYLDPAGVQKLLGLTSGQLDRALNSKFLQFPPPHGRRMSRTGLRSVPVWTRDALILWRDQIRDEIGALGF